MRPYASLWVLKGPYRCLFDFMDSHGSILVLMRHCGFLCVLMGPYASLWVFMGAYKFLCVLVCPYGSL